MLVEKPTIALFAKLGWETHNCFHEKFGAGGTLGRETSGECVLLSRLQLALRRLNPGTPDDVIESAIQDLTRDRRAMSLVAANREIYNVLRNGVKVRIETASKEEDRTKNIRLIDWNDPSKNDYLLCSQLWLSGEIYKRRADLVGFVNGLPLVFVELKASHKRLEDAYDNNLRDYKVAIPLIFQYNSLVILSNGSKAKIGTISSPWEHFNEWKRVDSEAEQGIISLETLVRGTCTPQKLLDIIENFTIFNEGRGGLEKMIAKNHQYLGVNNAFDALTGARENKGRLGVFWHTQGSGKSYSMIFFSQKVLRKLPGHWTFVVVTDRVELDDQIYKNFTNAGVLTEEKTQAESGIHLKILLSEDHRYIFSLIHKFHGERGQRFPVVSDRSDIIVIADEAHRTQYDTLALNMRNALPNAAFIAFTGTPLIIGEEKTRETFGDYVSVYNFRQSVEDGATVPLYYDNRIPVLQLANPNLREDIRRAVEAADLDEQQEGKLRREFAREYEVLTREDRLEKIAKDLVSHFMERGQLGKAMVVSIDRITAVRMYDKVMKYWNQYLEQLQKKVQRTIDIDDREEQERKISFMKETDMAVVISQSQNEVEDFAKNGLNIIPHRKRMVTEDLAEKFKDAKKTLRIVFVCSMWMTGFDAPSCSTIYLDKPLHNHTLMQTIARANRVFGEKTDGLIVGYSDAFQELKKALAIYGSASGGGIRPGEMPIEEKQVVVELLKGAIAETTKFCTQKGIDLERLRNSQGFERVKLLDDAVDAIVLNEDSELAYLSLAGKVDRLFRSILPDPSATTFAPDRTLFMVLGEKVRSLRPKIDISDIKQIIGSVLDKSVVAEDLGSEQAKSGNTYGHIIDLSRLDLEALGAHFKKGHKHVEAAKLRNAVGLKLASLVRANKTRLDLLARFEKMIQDYNSGAYDVEIFFSELVRFAKELNSEERRGITEQLSEEELAVFDLLTKPEMDLTLEERGRVKVVAKQLLETLKDGKLVLDWRKKQQARAGVKLAIEEGLDKLPPKFSLEIYQEKCELIYQHVYDSYFGSGTSLYSIA